MTRRPFYLIMLGGVILFLGLTFFVKQPPSGDEQAGTVEFDAEAAYSASCAGCHGADLEGAFGPTLVGLTLSSDEVIDIINNGRGQMPANTFQGSKAEKQALAEWILDHK